MDFNVEIMKSAFPLLLAGAGITLEITALSVAFGMLIGIIIALIRLSRLKPLRWLGNVYVDFIRGTPLLVQIFLVYFALPGLIGHRVDAFFAAIAACSINSGAYVAEIFRGGIQAVPRGQTEAARRHSVHRYRSDGSGTQFGYVLVADDALHYSASGI